MSKMEQKYLIDYSLDTLRDADIALSVPDDSQLFYDSDSSKWVNRPAPVFGRDFAEFQRVGLESFTGDQFQVYTSLIFNASEQSGTNKYRFFVNFSWGHDSATNDIRAAIRIDGGANLKEIRIEPSDAGTDQRIDSSILYYLRNLDSGSHTVDLLIRPATSNRQSRVYEAQLEVWRCQ